MKWQPTRGNCRSRLATGSQTFGGGPAVRLGLWSAVRVFLMVGTWERKKIKKPADEVTLCSVVSLLGTRGALFIPSPAE